MKIGSYPEDGTNDWNPDGTETEGVTHDNLNWYFTTQDVDKENAHLWRIPAKYALNQNVSSFEGVKSTTMQKQPSLKNANYNHWGDPDHYNYNGIEYILVPMTSTIKGKKPAIGVFIAESLYFVGYGELTGDTEHIHYHCQVDVGWCAVAPNTGDIFTSNDNPDVLIFDHDSLGFASSLFRYKIEWESISKFSGQGKFPPEYISYKSSDTLFIDRKLGVRGGNLLRNMQGGEFTPSGELLYISCGGGYCLGQGQDISPSDGIHVLDTVSWSEIKKSTNNERGEMGYFNYSFHNGCNACGFFGGGYGTHNPQGLTVWDLDDGKAPNITGQLHVLINFYNKGSLCDDALSFQHFSGKLFVDGLHGEPPTWTDWANKLPGSKGRPFFTINDAFTWYPVWDGAQIVVKNGTYGDIGSYKTRVKITGQGGKAIIGSAQPSIKGFVLYQHDHYKGDYRYFDHDVPDLDDDKINFNDVVTSIRLNNIKGIIAYRDAHFTGDTITITSNTTFLPSEWDDEITSIKIIR